MIFEDELAEVQDELDRKSLAIGLVATMHKEFNNMRRGAARRQARLWWNDAETDKPGGVRPRGLAAWERTRKARQDRLDRRGRCWRKIGFVTGDVYCGRHGRMAGWPCAKGGK